MICVMPGLFFARQKEGNDVGWSALIVGAREKREGLEEGRSVKFGSGGP